MGPRGRVMISPALELGIGLWRHGSRWSQGCCWPLSILGSSDRRFKPISLQPASPRYLSDKAQAQVADSIAASSEEGSQDEDLNVLKAALDKFMPDSSMQEAFRMNDVAKLRLTDIPATAKFMESFAAGKLPSTPLYDLPSWLEHNYPQYDASPKSPFFSWTVWIRYNLPREEQRLLQAFHDYMQQERFRVGIIRQANFELARLWNWQHQQAAAGLPLDIPRAPGSSMSGSASSSAQHAAVEGAGSKGKLLKGSPAEGSSSAAAPAAAAAGTFPSALPAPAPKAESSAALPGILGIIQQADKKQKQAQIEAQEQLVAQGLVDLTPEQRHLVSSLKAPDFEIRKLGLAFEDRLLRGSDLLSKPGHPRARDILRNELDSRAAAVVQATNNGLDFKEIESTTMLYDSKGDHREESPGSPGSVKLRKMYAADLRQAVQGCQHWTETQLLDHEANRKEMLSQSDDLKREIQRLKEADEKYVRRIQGVHAVELHKRPSTRTLDKLTEYLQVKYLDVLLQKEDMHAWVSQLPPAEQQRQFGAFLPQPVAAAPWRSLSPEQVSQLNSAASAAFHDIAHTCSTTQYAALMEQMKGRGLISQAELDESLAAARIKAVEARAAADRGQGQSHSSVSSEELLALLTGTSSSSSSSSSSVGPLSGAAAEAARLWGDTSKQSFSVWSKSMQAHVKADVAAARAQGQQLSDAQEQQLLSWWQQPVEFSEAQATWDEYLAAAGMPHGPRLEEVILTDQQVRAAAAAAAAGGAAPAPAPAASSLGEQLREVFQAFSRKHGSTISGAGGEADAGAQGGVELSWGEVQRINGELDVGAAPSLRSFFRCSSLKQVLSEHWSSTLARLAPGQQADSSSSSSSSPSSFEELWPLMLHVYESSLAHKPSAAESPAAAGTGPEPGPAASYPLAGFSPAAAAALEPQAARVQAEAAAASHSWGAYLQSMEEQAATATTLPATPPYPGAQPIVRFRQTFVLAPTPSTSTTSVASSGFGPGSQPGSIDNHPGNRAVELRVGIKQLQREANLSDAAMKLILRVCRGRRFDPIKRELVLSADSYPSREENRRLVMEQLHQLIAEGHAHAPQQQGAASPVVEQVERALRA